MNLTNDTYLILMGTERLTERYYRDEKGWLKVSARGRVFRATAEQVLNHLLPAVAGLHPNVWVRVEHHEEMCRCKGPKSRRADRTRATVRALRNLAESPKGGV